MIAGERLAERRRGEPYALLDQARANFEARDTYQNEVELEYAERAVERAWSPPPIANWK